MVKLGKETIHPKDLLILVLIYFVLAAIPFLKPLILVLGFFFFLIALWMGLNPKKAFFLFLLTFIFSFSIFILFVFFPDQSLENGEVFTFFGITFYSHVIINAFIRWIQLWSMSLCSISTGSVFDYERLLLYFMQIGKLPKRIGYSLVFALNSIEGFKEDFFRVRLNMKLRNIPSYHFFDLLFPILVGAFRHAYRGAMSLKARGLIEEKLFYHQFGPTEKEKKSSAFLYAFFIFLLLAYLVTWLLKTR